MRSMFNDTSSLRSHLATRRSGKARDMIAAAKITVPLMAQTVIDRCMQIHGAGGFTADYFMAEAFSYARWCRQADGPDQVHMMALGKQIIGEYAG